MLLTRRVKPAFYHDAMIETPPNEVSNEIAVEEADRQSASRFDETESLTIFNCKSLLVCLEGRRFAVVRPDFDSHMVFADDSKRDLRDLEAGDSVIYRGHPSVVKAVDVYC